MPTLDWAAILVDLGRANFHFPDLERFNFLVSVYRAAGKASLFTLKTLLDWPDLMARYSAVRILIRVPKEIFDVLEQSQEQVLSVSDFTSSSPMVKERAAFLATQNLNSLELCHAFFQLSNYNEEPQVMASLREEFRNNVELLTLAGSELPVSLLGTIVDCRNHGQIQRKHSSSMDFSTSSEHKELTNSSSPEPIKSTLPLLRNCSSNTSLENLKRFQGSAILPKKSRSFQNCFVFNRTPSH